MVESLSHVFFLGGRDLEMVTIAEMLTLLGIEHHDRKLAWGAKASDYRAEIVAALAAGRTVVLLELPDDLHLAHSHPDRVVEVDHHGERAGKDKPTSLQQVFELLGCPEGVWTRRHDLVSANDLGHVAEMIAFGATPHEIAEIRLADRTAQGISAEEDAIGREAAKNSRVLVGGRLTLVRCPHSRTATITDALEPILGGPGYENLLIISPHEVSLFGPGRSIRFADKKFPGGWSGGSLPDRGFWGHPGPIDETQLLATLEAAIMTKPASEIVIEKFHHVLVWPLILKGRGSLDCKIPFDSWITALHDAGWDEVLNDKNSKRVATDLSYEEIIYFHPFVRDFLFGDGKTLRDERPMRRMARNDVKRVVVEMVRENQLDRFDFKVERAEIYLCKPDVLVFTIEVSNINADGAYFPLKLDQVHDFRDRFRRIHPPFWADGREPEAKQAGLCPTKVAWIGMSKPIPPTMAIDSPRKEFDDFSHIGGEPPIFAHWRCWFGERIQPLQRHLRESEPAPGLFVQQIMDERMQCFSYLAAKEPKEISEGDRDRLTFVDAAGTDEHPYNSEFLRRTRQEHVYDRFSNYDTTYFFCSYAFTVLGRASDFFFANHVLGHFQTHYHHMGIVAHFQRAALLYFADEMATAAKMLANIEASQESSHKPYRDRLNVLQMLFLKFRSRSYFPEITNQLQGQELYRKLYQHLGIKELFDQVDDTCDQLNEVLTQRETERLTTAASWGLGISIALSCAQLGVAVAGVESMSGGIWYFGGSLLASMLVFWMALNHRRPK